MKSKHFKLVFYLLIFLKFKSTLIQSIDNFLKEDVENENVLTEFMNKGEIDGCFSSE